jgi:hypothetical protein
MPLLARGQLLLSAIGVALLACTTYSEPPSGPEASAGAQATGGTSDGGTSEPVGASGGASGSASGSGASAAASGKSSGGMTGQAGAIDEGVAGAAACIDGDCCPDDPDKTEAGDCGCGVADSDADTDGILDCQDDCPDDPNKQSPQTCGCGLPEQDTAELAGCGSLQAALIHRYDFEGDGMVWDRVGSADGTIVGLAQQTQMDERGVLPLVGNGAYVNFPNFLISELQDVSIEAWVSWNGGKAWQRIFDFGESDAQPNPEDVPKSGKSYLFLTSMAAGTGSRFGFSLSGANNERGVSLPMALAPTVNHVVAVVDSVQDKMLYYLNGELGGETAFEADLADINDVNVWLGRSQYSLDPAFTGTYHEFRIYDQPLTALEVATSFAAGPDPDFLVR